MLLALDLRHQGLVIEKGVLKAKAASDSEETLWLFKGYPAFNPPRGRNPLPKVTEFLAQSVEVPQASASDHEKEMSMDSS